VILETATAVVGVGGVSLYLYERFTGCRGGHVWGEWSETSRVRTVPYGSKPSVCVEKQYRRCCERSDCDHSETEYRSVTGEVYADSIEIDVVERQSKCPSCGEAFPESCISSSWMHGVNSGMRLNTCPSCESRDPSTFWDRVPYAEVDDR
jgi:hypothetical protein